jgi:hypothetical protein
VLAYTRPATAYGRIRTLVLGPDGTASTQVRPAGNTRLYAVTAGAPAGPSVVVAVQSRLDLSVRRTGPRTYAFSGRVFPARGGQVVTVHRVVRGGVAALASTRTRADGRWTVTRRFLGSAVLDLVARTPADHVNVVGSSSVRRTTVR